MKLPRIFGATIAGVALALPLTGCSKSPQAEIEKAEARASRFKSEVTAENIKKALENSGVKVLSIKWRELDPDYPHDGYAELWSILNCCRISYEKDPNVDENKINEILDEAGLLLTDEEYSREYEELQKNYDHRYYVGDGDITIRRL